MEIAALGLKVEGVSSIEQAASSLDHLASSAGGAERATTALDPTSRRSSQAVQQLGSSSDSTSSSLNSLGSVATKVGGVLAAAFSIKKVIEYADAWSDMQSRVGAATGQMELAAGNMQRLLQIANASYSPLEQTAEIYSRNVSAFRDLGRSAAEAADFTESLNNMLVLTATRGERAASVQDALAKAMAVGKIEADGLETVLANGGEVAQALAKELGTTVSGLRAMASQGKITGDVIASAVVKPLDDVRTRASEMPATMGDAFTRVGNNLTAFVGIIDQATGASGSLASAIISFADAALEIATSSDAIAGFLIWKGTIEAVAQDIVSLGNLIYEFARDTLGDVDSISLSFAEMPANIRAMIKIAVVEIASFIDAQMNGIRALGAAIKALPDGPTAAMDAFDAVRADVRAEMEHLGQVRLDSIKNILNERDAIVQAGRDAANSYAETNRKALEFNASVVQTTGTVGTFTKEQEKAVKGLSDFVSQSALSVSNAAAMTAAYLSGSGAVAKLTREQKIEAEVLKLGEKNRAEVTRRINEMEDALESLDLAKSISQMRDQNKELAAYGQVLALGGTTTKAGRDALKTFNNEREIEAALVGKTSAEITKLIPKLREEQRVRDSLRDGNARIERLNALVAETRTVTEKANIELAELAELAASTRDPVYLDAINRKMQEVQASTSEWGQFTERALDSVDQAFADAWKNIGQGFGGFADGLKDAFKNLLAELAHMAITRPIVMQIGAALGVGGLAGQASGLFGGSGGGLLADIWNYGSSAYSAATSGFGQAVMAGWDSGGLTGALSGGWDYGSNAIGNLGSTVSGWFGGGGGGAAAADYSGAAFANWLNGGSAGVGATQAGYSGAAMQNWVAMQNAGNWGTALTSTGALLGGVGGALYGYGQSGWKGAAVGGLGGWAGAAAGSVAGASVGGYVGGTFGSILPGIGTAIGAALGSYIGGSLFNGKWQTKDVGIALGIESGALSAQGFEYQKKKRGGWRGGKQRTNYDDLDSEAAATLGDAFSATVDGVFDLFESLSYTIEDSALAGLNLAKTHISTGKTEEEIQQAIVEWFGTVANTMTAELQSMFGTGLDLDFAGMQAFVGNLKGVNEVIRYLNVGMFDASVAGGKLAEQLSGITGGLGNLANNAGTYYNAFFTEAEKTEDTIDSIKRAFEAAGTELASSREAYRAMVEDIDITTEAGQEMFATLMALSGQAAAYYDIMEARANQLAAQLAADEKFYYQQFTPASVQESDGLKDIINGFAELEFTLPGARSGFIAAIDAIDRTTESGQKMYESLMGAAAAADAYYDIIEQRASAAIGAAYSLLERSVNAEKAALTEAYRREKAEQDALLQQRRESQRQYQQAMANSYRDMMQTASATASALGSLSNSLSSALGDLLDQSTEAMIQRRSAAVMQLKNALRTGNLSNAEQLAEAARIASNVDSGQYATLADYEREQGRTANILAELGDLTASRKTAAEQQVEQLQKLYDQANSAAQSLGQSIGSVKTSVDYAYEEQIKALDEQLALAKSQIDALNGIDNSVVSVSDAIKSLASAISAAIEQIPGLSDVSIPGFATGGAFTNGVVSRPTAFNMGIMGEAGAEGVLPLANIGGRLGVHANVGGKDTAELQAVRAELSEMKRVLVEIMWSSKETATATRNIDEGGVVIDNGGAVMA